MTEYTRNTPNQPAVNSAPPGRPPGMEKSTMAGAAYMNPPAPPKPLSLMPATTPSPMAGPMGAPAPATPQSVARSQVAPPPPPPPMSPAAPGVSGGAGPAPSQPQPQSGQMTQQGQGAHYSSPESGIQDGTQAQPGQPGQGQPGGAPARSFVSYFTPDHFGQMQPGESVDTPMGTVSRGPDGQPHILLSEQGKAQHARLRQEEMTRYGDHPFKALPGAPQPPITPGAPHFNPFTGRFTDGWE